VFCNNYKVENKLKVPIEPWSKLNTVNS